MSPVSRSRKKSKKKPSRAPLSAGRGKRPADRELAWSEPEYPGTPVPTAASVEGLMERLSARKPKLAQSFTRVLDGSEALLTASGPRELEQAACVLIGAELDDPDGRAGGYRLDLYIADLADVALERIASVHASEQFADGGWQGPYFLLQAMTGLASPGDGIQAAARVDAAKKLLGEATTRLPPWLYELGKQSATGELWQLTDVYGGRHGVIAGFTYADGEDESVYLFDIETGEYAADLASAGVYDDAEQAAAAWRETVGPDAADVLLRPITDPGELYPLAYLEVGEGNLDRAAPRSVLDNLYRAQRRLADVRAALARRRTPLAETIDLYRDIDTEPVVTEFTAWYTARHGDAPDPEATAALAEQWLEGATPGIEHLISPVRVRHIRALIAEWAEDAVTATVRGLYPEWIRWHGEARELPSQLIENSVALAATAPGQE